MRPRAIYPPLLAVLLLATVASADVTPPAQPRSGPGGGNYRHGDWRVSSGGSGSDAWYVFEPVDPQPRSAPLAIVMHGYGEFAGYDSMYELVRHTVRKGNVVVYPRWQTSIVEPCLGPFDIEPCMASSVNGIRGALSYLQADPTRVQPDVRRTSYFGFSFGGIAVVESRRLHGRPERRRSRRRLRLELLLEGLRCDARLRVFQEALRACAGTHAQASLPRQVERRRSRRSVEGAGRGTDRPMT